MINLKCLKNKNKFFILKKFNKIGKIKQRNKDLNNYKIEKVYLHKKYKN